MRICAPMVYAAWSTEFPKNGTKESHRHFCASRTVGWAKEALVFIASSIAVCKED